VGGATYVVLRVLVIVVSIEKVLDTSAMSGNPRVAVTDRPTEMEDVSERETV
jgi:hypothetical protein